MSPNPIQSILPLELLLKYNFFDLYPFDGGGSFIHRKYIHSIDDIKGAENILNGFVKPAYIEDFTEALLIDVRPKLFFEKGAKKWKQL